MSLLLTGVDLVELVNGRLVERESKKPVDDTHWLTSVLRVLFK